MNDFYFYCSFVDEYDPTIGKQSLPCLRVWILLVYCCHDLGFSCVMDSLLSQTFFFFLIMGLEEFWLQMRQIVPMVPGIIFILLGFEVMKREVPSLIWFLMW